MSFAAAYSTVERIPMAASEPKLDVADRLSSTRDLPIDGRRIVVKYEFADDDFIGYACRTRSAP